ncbi:hypothetical protein AKJ51_02925 [candidate division MSBL1 archaeon SCGC-AAA382A20]|uniref:Uncharacterized protein n=1 Tax=candidate division MSBL1 archaeon SCGC-AAA382A20 TaxID=1698280 RepID=A0A133VK18_9EURY|nr:hypothetical protein AKJ51_02925 [candidate division MSBL1 archaeon SCGC-AAA382A20]
MTEKKEAGLVSLEALFGDLLAVEEIIQKNSVDKNLGEIERAISFLEKIKEDLSYLAKEKNVKELYYLLDAIEVAMKNLESDLDAPKALESLKSAEILLMRYNLRGRRSI